MGEGYYYSLFLVFVVLSYLIVTDKSVATFVILLQKIVKLNFEKLKWWILYNPANPIVKYLMHRRSIKMAEELMKTFEEKE